tara:strand:+ start:6342 stop:6869 length:528 start_codon:yes stop_codon:yes gene_type:complete
VSIPSLKLHLGCGEKHIDGFVNIDSRDGPNVDLVCDINHLHYHPSSVDTIYMCHSLEHIPMLEVVSTLKRLNSLLVPDGRLYISVPDFEVLASLYLSRRVTLSSIVRAIHGGQEYPGNTHYMSYDHSILSSTLLSCGFSSVINYSPQEFLPIGFTDTSTYKIGGKFISLNMCAIK